ncbi:hypothetical protein Sango_2103700 [Sesamum angolense]|uniref:Transposase MuDR plant domain-containing protein n=1 Tax=Sesamum angolense TaxID=2727404 RepID=A0AAE1WBY7_9LAMI|nr:hypothetical protein Sango_2103700 [Sesamum angolense]
MGQQLSDSSLEHCLELSPIASSSTGWTWASSWLIVHSNVLRIINDSPPTHSRVLNSTHLLNMFILNNSDHDLQVKNPITILSEKMEGEYFEFSHDNSGKQIIILKEGMIFDNVQHFKDILARYTIQEGIKLKKLKNDKARVTVVCNNEDCSWRLHACTYADCVTFKIKNTKGVQTCVRNLKSTGATAKWIAHEFKEEYKNNLEKSVGDLDSALRAKFGVHASSSKLFRARKIAMQIALGDHEKSYASMPKYTAALKESNSGAFVKLKCDGLDITNPNYNPKFERILISFEAQYQGYIKGCRPFIGVDGCFLKGTYKGELFRAVALDVNLGIFPIAIMMCEGENEDNWKAKFPGPKLRKLFWIAAKAYTFGDSKNAMEEIKATDLAAHKWLMETCGEEPSTWSRHGFDASVKVDHVTNNITESFNAFLGKIRQRPVISLLEWYRTKYVHPYWTTEAYLMTYSGMINVVPDESRWPENDQIPPLMPPTLKRKNRVFKQSRLQTKRRMEPNEPPKGHKRQIHITSKVHFQVGHNKRTCW